MLCLLTAAGVVVATMAATEFTLVWTHSVEKVAWHEDWRVEAGRLVAVAARVKGSGAGMEPADGAVLVDGWWTYRPSLPPQERLVLTRSPYVDDYRLCWDGACRAMADLAPMGAQPDLTIIEPCAAGR